MGTQLLSPKSGQISQFFALLWLNVCTEQDATWYGGRPWPRRLCVRRGPRSPSPPNFGQTSGRYRYGPKIGGCAPWGGGAEFPSNTLWPGSRPICVPNFILIRPTIWQQCTNVTDRTGQSDRTGQRSNSTGRTVLQTVAQKCAENWGGGSSPFLGRALGPHLIQCGLDQGSPSYQVPS